MAKLPVVFRNNEGRYKFIGDAQVVNGFAEQLGNDAKGPLAVLPSPGMVAACINGDTPCRGMIYLPDLDCIYSVHTSGVYKVTRASGNTFSLNTTFIGVILGSDIVQMSRNQKSPNPQIVIHTSTTEYIIENDVLSEVTDPQLPATVVSTDTVGPYTVYGEEDGTFTISSINDATAIAALDFATAEISADPLVRVKEDRGELYLFGTQTVEQWQNTGASAFPFERLSGATIQKGLLAANAVVQLDNTLFWPSDDWNIRKLSAGNATSVVSTPSISRIIENDTSQGSIIGFAHSGEGHEFGTWTGTNWTRVYDAKTDQWHSRKSYGYDYWQGRFAVRAWGKTIIGSALSGTIYYLDKETYDEGGEPLIWGVTFPPLYVDSGDYKGFRLDAIYFDVMVGAGKTLASAQGFDPVMMMDVSADGGNTFGIQRQLKLGKRGKYTQRVTAFRLGRFSEKGATIRLSISDPVARAIVGGGVKVTPLKA